MVSTLTVSEAAMLVLLMRGIYKVRYCDSLRWENIHIKFHEDWFRRLEVVRGTNTHTHTHREQGHFISLILFFQNKRRRLKIRENITHKIEYKEE
jgi:hypothetical protein